MIGAIARNRELSGLNLNDLDMKRLLADFLLFSVPVSAENIVQKPFTEKHAELNSVILTRSLPDQAKSSFWSDVSNGSIVDCQSGLLVATINPSVQGATDKSWMMDWVKGAVVGFCFN